MFDYCIKLTSINVSSFNTSKVTNMHKMFDSCSSLTSIDVSHFNTSNVTEMDYMFADCENLTSVNLSGFNTSNVIYMFGMFQNCSSLTTLDLSSFNTANMTLMAYMFADCTNLRTIYAGNGWTTAALVGKEGEFLNCTNLVGGMGTTYSSNRVNATYARIDGGPSSPGYFTAKSAGLLGDVDGDGNVGISDVTALVDYILDHSNEIVADAADVDLDGNIGIADVTVLIDYLLNGTW